MCQLPFNCTQLEGDGGTQSGLFEQQIGAWVHHDSNESRHVALPMSLLQGL